MKLGFHLNADNCIGCHSCEAACSEKNNLPAHIAWRKVGILEGGTYPDYRRVNISMACNHCDNPVCLQGCPTRAYTKHADTGAVIQDSDTCFGCRYCTWVCPYNAPAYNPDTGSVSKCNMCVDRLAVGKKPACVDACLGFALDFGEVDRMAETHRRTDRTIPGFPDTAITTPNIRFQQERSLPGAMMRVDQTESRRLYPPVSLAPGGGEGQVCPERSRRGEGDRRNGAPKSRITLSTLRSDEDSLVIFTLLTQMVVGGVTLFTGGLGFSLLNPSAKSAGVWRTLLFEFPGQAAMTLALVLMALGLGLSTAHLGKPWRCYRALNNLRHSWVSREILFLGMTFGALAVFTGSLLYPWAGSGTLAVLGGAAAVSGWLGIWAMIRIYRIPARPYWNHPHTAAAFTASGLILGPLFLGGVLFAGKAFAGGTVDMLFPVLTPMVWVALAGFLLQAGAAILHWRDLGTGSEEGRFSRRLLLEDYRYIFRLRWVLSALSVLCMIVLLGMEGSPVAQVLLWWGGFLSALGGEVIGRALFYKAVVPMTMPGAFFRENRAFEAYARETGLARDPHVGVVMEHH